MVDGSGTSGHDVDRGLAAVQEAQRSLEARVESLTADFQRFAPEMRKELRAIRGMGVTPSVNTPAMGTGFPVRGEQSFITGDVRKPARYDSFAAADSLERNRSIPRTAHVESDSDEDPLFEEPPVQRQYTADRNELKLKIDVPYFDGHLHIEDYLGWE